ncbi:DUF962-domain-containing protein [Hyaloscypha variabilis F]|uniref:DUF962-domain-containing protein n=1 Tax=Hyaloscypha variabilis (strain UAMH 11265 / GT02V1 / F) TaxID=1149755 RepID=A0A2J6S5N5_HYAVF|nr:DUF962-domain-containing protein [Hyaloscypha variabilis F]
MSFDLKKQLAFYGAYHNNKVNVGIHITCVPILFMTAVLLGSNVTLPKLPSFLRKYPLNLGTTAAAVYSVLYVYLEPIAGLTLAPLLLTGAATMSTLRAKFGNVANRWAVAVHLGTWILQFIGHGKFEGRAPALLDNLFQALFLAPFFVWFEILFKLGYRPKLKRDVDLAIKEAIAKFKAGRKGEESS